MHGCACHGTQMWAFSIYSVERYLGDRSKTLRVIDRVAPTHRLPRCGNFSILNEKKKKFVLPRPREEREERSFVLG